MRSRDSMGESTPDRTSRAARRAVRAPPPPNASATATRFSGVVRWRRTNESPRTTSSTRERRVDRSRKVCSGVVMGSPRKVVTAVAGLAVCAWIPRRSDRFPSATLTWVRDWSGTPPAPDLGRGEMARRGPWGADLQRGACAHHGCHLDGGRDVQVVEDLLEPWSAQLSDPETCRPSLGTGEEHGRGESGLTAPGSRWSGHLPSMTQAGSGGWPLSTGCGTAGSHAGMAYARLPPGVGRRTASSPAPSRYGTLTPASPAGVREHGHRSWGCSRRRIGRAVRAAPITHNSRVRS